MMHLMAFPSMTSSMTHPYVCDLNQHIYSAIRSRGGTARLFFKYDQYIVLFIMWLMLKKCVSLWADYRNI